MVSEFNAHTIRTLHLSFTCSTFTKYFEMSPCRRFCIARIIRKSGGLASIYSVCAFVSLLKLNKFMKISFIRLTAVYGLPMTPLESNFAQLALNRILYVRSRISANITKSYWNVMLRPNINCDVETFNMLACLSTNVCQQL